MRERLREIMSEKERLFLRKNVEKRRHVGTVIEMFCDRMEENRINA